MATPKKSKKQISENSKGSVEGALMALLSKVQEHDQRSQMYLRDDMADLYEYAHEIRGSAERFLEFQSSELAAKLKRVPKMADQTLRAVMNLAYSTKLASARYRRLKNFWDMRSPADEVREDLRKNGASRKRVRLEVEPISFLAFRLDQLSAGTEVGLYVQATAVTPERLVCTIVDVAEYPDCIR